MFRYLDEITSILIGLRMVRETTGPERKTALSELAVEILSLAEQITNKDILDDGAVRKATPEIVEGIKAIIEVIETRPERSGELVS